MKAFFFTLFFVLMTSHSFSVHSTTLETYVGELESRALEKTLWAERAWLNLLHYKPVKSLISLSSDISYTSFVDDTQFFIADQGATEPRAELLATLNGFFDHSGAGDDHPQCRFPARLAWLREHVSIDPARLPKVDCPLYRKWKSMVDVGSVVLVFPAHHLNSPSSMFGHTLLRLDPSAEREHSDWLAYGVNFGANIPAGDNSFFYAYKGLTGGYPGQFIVEPYFKKIQEYNRVENRDIWEYPLNLTAKESRRLGTHLWELKDINFDYFFFLENCSYRLLELLEVARPAVELTDDFSGVAIPIDTVRSVYSAGFINGNRYRPSIASQLHFQLSALPENVFPLLLELSKDTSVLEREDFLALPEEQQYKMLQAAYGTVRYRQAKKGRSAVSAKHSLALLTAISAYPQQRLSNVPSPVAPEEAHQSKRLVLGRGRDDDSNFSELGFRMAYHSLLDNRHGFLEGAQINMASFKVRHYDDDSLKLERFDVADVFSLTPRDAIFDSLSWKVYGGLERVSMKDERPLVAHITGGAGYAYALNETTLYALFDVRVEHNKEFYKPVELGLGVELGWLYHNPWGAGTVTASGIGFSGGELRVDVGFEQDIVLSVNHSLRIKMGRHWRDGYQSNEVSLNYHYFFK